MASVVTLEQYFGAVQNGDSRTIAAFAFRVASHPEDVLPTDDHKRQAGAEWLLPFDENTQFDGPDSLISISIERDYANVLELLFSAEVTKTIGAERLVVAIRAACHSAVRANAIGLLELLLGSHVFANLLSDQEQQALLDEMLCPHSFMPIPDMVRLLAAHGASFQNRIVLDQAAEIGDLADVDAVIREGAFTVGVWVSDPIHNPEVLQRLFERGCLPIPTLTIFHAFFGCKHILSARKRLKIWLQYGFFDVDTRDSMGQTPLMQIEQFCSGRRHPDGEKFWTGIADLLLDYGACGTRGSIPRPRVMRCWI